MRPERIWSCWPFLVATVVLGATPARADPEDYANPDRPGIADESTVIGPHRFQVEAGLQQEMRKTDGASDHRLFTPLLLRFGLTEALEARVETLNGYTWAKTSDPANGTTRSEGWNPVSVGVKYQFETAKGFERPSMGIIARLFPASGSGAFRSHHMTGDVRLAADWQIAEKWSLNPNVGIAYYEDDAGRLFTSGLFAFTVNYNPSQRLNFFLDTGEQYPERKDGRGSAIVDTGVAYMLTHDIQLDLSVGTGVAGKTPPHPFIGAGISRRF
jgi:hypothetical protein